MRMRVTGPVAVVLAATLGFTVVNARAQQAPGAAAASAAPEVIGKGLSDEEGEGEEGDNKK